VLILGIFLLFEAIGIMVFSTMDVLPWAIVTMLMFAMFLKMSNGATYSVVPFINKKAIGAVSGIVGAGGNVGAVLAGMLLASNDVSYRSGLFLIGIAVAVVSVLAMFLAFFKMSEPHTKATPKFEDALAYIPVNK
jgi:NNP family nitrate/nitrite transporter-like MFS transporter